MVILPNYKASEVAGREKLLLPVIEGYHHEGEQQGRRREFELLVVVQDMFGEVV